MQSQNPNGENPSRENLEEMRRTSHVPTHKEGETHVSEEPRPTLLALEDGAEEQGASDDFSFIDHLSSREIYQMPTGDTASVWNTYELRFTDALPQTGHVASVESPKSIASAQEELPVVEESPSLMQSAPKTKNVRVITPVDHATVASHTDQVPSPTPEDPTTTRIVASAAPHSPILSTSATAEENSVGMRGEVTVVEVGQGASEEDVFVLPKRMQNRELLENGERTEEDEMRDILETISPLSTITTPEPEETLASMEPSVTPQEETTIPAEELNNEDIAAEPIPEEVPSVTLTEEAIAEANPLPELEQPHDVFAHISPDYDMPKASDIPRDTPFSTEFIAYSQQSAIKDSFLDKILSVKVRLVCSGILTIALFVLALLPVFGISLIELYSLQRIPYILALMDLQGVLCLLALSIPEMLRAYRDIFRGKVRSEFLLFVHFIFMIVYTAFIVIIKPVQYPLFGSLFGLLAFLCVLSSHYLHKAEFLSFRTLSIPQEKTVCLASPTQSLVHEKFALDGVVDEYKSRCARFFRSTFVDGFVAKNKKTSENSVKILTIVCVSIVSSLVVGIISFILKDIRAALYSFMGVLSFSSPLFYVLSHKLSYFKAERIGLAEDATVVGESTFEEYAAVDVVTYLDTEIFGMEDVALRRFKLIGEEKDFTKPLRQMASLFGVIGGPLAILFENALERHVAPSEDVVIETDGIYGKVDGVMVYAGSEEFMHRHNIEIPADDTATGLESAPTTKVLYSAEENRVHAKFYIRYSFSEDFTMLLPSLRKAGITPLIYTRDPNITPDLLKALTLGEANVRVMKKYNAKNEDSPLYPRLDGGVVTLGDKTGMLNMLLLCKKYRAFTRFVENLLPIVTALGAVIGGVLSIFLSPSLPIWGYALWQCAWLAFFAIYSRVTFRLPKKSQKEK